MLSYSDLGHRKAYIPKCGTKTWIILKNCIMYIVYHCTHNVSMVMLQTAHLQTYKTLSTLFNHANKIFVKKVSLRYNSHSLLVALNRVYVTAVTHF